MVGTVGAARSLPTEEFILPFFTLSCRGDFELGGGRFFKKTTFKTKVFKSVVVEANEEIRNSL